MFASCSKFVGRRRPRILADIAPGLNSSSTQSFLQSRSQQQWRKSTLSHVRGLRRPRRADVLEDDLDLYQDYRPERVQVASPSSNSTLAKFNLELANLDKIGRISAAFDVCHRMKVAKVDPNKTTYDHLLSLCATHAAPREAWAILEDMAAMGIPPDRSAIHHVMTAMEARHLRGLWQLLELMQDLDIEPDSRTFDLVITRLLDGKNMELALQYLALMSDRGLVPLVNTAAGMIRAACRLSLPKLACDLAQSFEEVSVRRLDGEIWMDCLVACAESLYAVGTQDAWHKCVHELNLIPDEGCCIRVLNTAAREGLPDLARDVIRALASFRVSWEEHHFAPLIEAFCRCKDLKPAFELLGTMHNYQVKPDAGTAHPIYLAIEGSVDKLDAAWQAVDQLNADGQVVDVVALNVIVRAAAKMGDLQRALGIYKAFPEFRASPDVDTFNILLAGCIKTSHRQLGDRLLLEMKEAHIKPDVITFERVIALCLTQATYEDAFYYLEEMKAEGFVPSRYIYERIIRKCVLTGDSRHQIALEEMLSHGYDILPRLQAFVDSGGQQDDAVERAPDSDTYASTRPQKRHRREAGSRGIGITI